MRDSALGRRHFRHPDRARSLFILSAARDLSTSNAAPQATPPVELMHALGRDDIGPPRGPRPSSTALSSTTTIASAPRLFLIVLVFAITTAVLGATTPVNAAASGASTTGNETVFGDVVVRAEQTGGGAISHGYTEFRFTISNHGASQHTVEINAPAVRFSLSPGSIAQLSRSVVLSPGSTATLSLYQPALVVSGQNAEVVIDGTVQEAQVQFAPVYASGTMMRILGSRAVNDAELRTTLELHLRPEEFEIVTASDETAEWSRNWLSLTPFDALVMTGAELGRAGADVRLAIDRFARAGGVLVLLDSLPASDCVGQMSLPESLSFCSRGFGLRVSTVAPITAWTPDDVKLLGEEVRRSQAPIKAYGGFSGHPTKGPPFQVVENLSVPLRGLFIAMILFAITAGPLNLAVLSKMNKRIWIIWTLPAIALATSLIVIVIASFSEGWVKAARTDAITWIDPQTREATTIGWTGYYATVAPSEGLRFDAQTELHPFGGSRSNALDVDWTNGQHLSSGWLSSRVTSTFRVRKSEPRRERLTFRRTGGGLTLSNGLGAPIEEVWVADDDGSVWTAKNIEAGGSQSLERSPAGAVGSNYLRDLYGNDWLQAVERARLTPGSIIQPGRWAAVIDGGPFIEEAMPGVRTRNGQTLVMSELTIGDAE